MEKLPITPIKQQALVTKDTANGRVSFGLNEANLTEVVKLADIDTTTGVASKKSVRASVLDYGAKMDGTTDDTAAFQAAIDAVGTPYVPAGIAKLNGTLYARKHGDGLIGHSPAKTLLRCLTTAFALDPTKLKFTGSSCEI